MWFEFISEQNTTDPIYVLRQIQQNRNHFISLLRIWKKHLIVFHVVCFVVVKLGKIVNRGMGSNANI